MRFAGIPPQRWREVKQRINPKTQVQTTNLGHPAGIHPRRWREVKRKINPKTQVQTTNLGHPADKGLRRELLSYKGAFNGAVWLVHCVSHGPDHRDTRDTRSAGSGAAV